MNGRRYTINNKKIGTPIFASHQLSLLRLCDSKSNALNIFAFLYQFYTLVKENCLLSPLRLRKSDNFRKRNEGKKQRILKTICLQGAIEKKQYC